MNNNFSGPAWRQAWAKINSAPKVVSYCCSGIPGPTGPTGPAGGTTGPTGPTGPTDT